MTTTRVLVFSLVLALLSALSASAQWTRISGPLPPHVSELAAHEDLLVLGTDFADRGDLFISADGGHNWTDAGLPNGGVACILSHGGRLFVGGYLSGLFYSDDDGASWTSTGTPLSSSTTEAVVALDAGTMIAGQDQFFPVPLYRSDDHGETWAAIDSGPSLRCFDLIHHDGIVLACGDQAGIWRSADGGLTWAPANAGLPSGATTYRFTRVGSSFFVVAWKISELQMSVFRSDDLGQSWTQVHDDPITNAWKAAHFSYQDGAMYLGAEGTAGTRGIYRSDDEGATWSLITADLPQGWDPSGMAALEVDGDLLVGTLNGCFRSEDDGTSWDESWQGSSGVTVAQALLFDGEKLHASFEDNVSQVEGVAVSQDLGQSWSGATIPGSSSVVWDFTMHGGNIFAVIYGFPRGVAVSSDGGHTYEFSSTDIPSGIVPRCLVSHDGNLLLGTHTGIFISTDDGLNWTHDPTLGNVTCLISHDGFLWAGLYPGGVVRSADGGLSWTQLDDGLPASEHINTIAVHDGTVWAGLNIGPVVRWNGASWDDSGTDASYGLVSTGPVLFNGTHNGTIEYTLDGGATWIDFTGNYSGDTVQVMEVTDTHLVVGARGSAFWVRPLSDLPGVSASPDTPERQAMGLRVAPNPFNPQTDIRFELAEAGPVTVDLYDAAGRRIRRLVNGHLGAGQHAVNWDGRDGSGRAVASGLYLVKAVSNQGLATTRAVLVR